MQAPNENKPSTETDDEKAGSAYDRLIDDLYTGWPDTAPEDSDNK